MVKLGLASSKQGQSWPAGTQSAAISRVTRVAQDLTILPHNTYANLVGTALNAQGNQHDGASCRWGEVGGCVLSPALKQVSCSFRSCSATKASVCFQEPLFRFKSQSSFAVVHVQLHFSPVGPTSPSNYARYQIHEGAV